MYYLLCLTNWCVRHFRHYFWITWCRCGDLTKYVSDRVSRLSDVSKASKIWFFNLNSLRKSADSCSKKKDLVRRQDLVRIQDKMAGKKFTIRIKLLNDLREVNCCNLPLWYVRRIYVLSMDRKLVYLSNFCSILNAHRNLGPLSPDIWISAHPDDLMLAWPF